MSQVWEIVGGAQSGGILVREGKSSKSTQFDQRLSRGSLVEQLALEGDRLQYKILEGEGPEQGWVSVKITGKELAAKTDKKPKAAIIPEKVGPNGEAPLPVGLLFPGQGSQYVKMLSGVKDLPRVKEMLDTAKEILGYDILQICLEGPEEKLEETRYCQPAMFLGGLAAVEKLRGEKPEAVQRCQVMAGLSLGEYTALCAAGVFSFEDGLRLVKLRGEAMQEAATKSQQLMLSVIGLPKDALNKLCKEARQEVGEKAVCQIANELFPNGFACGGDKPAIEKLQKAAESAGALSAKVLKTSGAFHTPLMQPAQEQLAAALEEILPKMNSPLHTVWMNATAEPMHPGSDPKDIVELMKKQLTSPVRWEPSVKQMINAGIKEFYEVGPQKQVKAMMKRISQPVWQKTVNVEV